MSSITYGSTQGRGDDRATPSLFTGGSRPLTRYTSNNNHYYLYVLQGVVAGVASTLLTVYGLPCVVTWWHTHRGRSSRSRTNGNGPNNKPVRVVGDSHRETAKVFKKEEENKEPEQEPKQEATMVVNHVDDHHFDRADLPLRLLRKAEGVLQFRSQLLIVIERIVNDFNYSAILRTAEALGIQDVWLIDPPISLSHHHPLRPKPRRQRQQMSQQRVCAASKSDLNNAADSAVVVVDTDEINGINDDGDSENADHGNNGRIDDLDEPPIMQVDQQTTTTTTQNGKSLQRLLTKEEHVQRREHHLFAQNATAWLSLREFSTTGDCLRALQQQHYRIWATDLSQDAIPLTRECLGLLLEDDNNMDNYNHKDDDDRPSPPPPPLPSSSSISSKLALVFGTESVGVSAEMLQHCHRRVYLPLRGFADSLNVSVATALILHQVLSLFPHFVGNYPDPAKAVLRRDWYTKLAGQRRLSSQQKKRRRKCQSALADCARYQQKIQQRGEEALTMEQQQKLDRLPDFEREWQQLERIRTHQGDDIDDDVVDDGDGDNDKDKTTEDSDATTRRLDIDIQSYIDHPPPPLTDLRRANVHRVSYVGRNTKRAHAQLWEGTVAVAKPHYTHRITSQYFRRYRHACEITNTTTNTHSRATTNHVAPVPAAQTTTTACALSPTPTTPTPSTTKIQPIAIATTPTRHVGDVDEQQRGH